MAPRGVRARRRHPAGRAVLTYWAEGAHPVRLGRAGGAGLLRHPARAGVLHPAVPHINVPARYHALLRREFPWLAVVAAALPPLGLLLPERARLAPVVVARAAAGQVAAAGERACADGRALPVGGRVHLDRDAGSGAALGAHGAGAFRDRPADPGPVGGAPCRILPRAALLARVALVLHAVDAVARHKVLVAQAALGAHYEDAVAADVRAWDAGRVVLALAHIARRLPALDLRLGAVRGPALLDLTVIHQAARPQRRGA